MPPEPLEPGRTVGPSVLGPVLGDFICPGVKLGSFLDLSIEDAGIPLEDPAGVEEPRTVGPSVFGPVAGDFISPGVNLSPVIVPLVVDSARAVSSSCLFLRECLVPCFLLASRSSLAFGVMPLS